MLQGIISYLFLGIDLVEQEEMYQRESDDISASLRAQAIHALRVKGSRHVSEQRYNQFMGLVNANSVTSFIPSLKQALESQGVRISDSKLINLLDEQQ